MNARALREIPLRILKRKVGDERVTLLQACYDNPVCEEDEARGFPSQHRSGKSQEYSIDGFEDGINGRGPTFSAPKHSATCHVANDYMHSLPASRSMPNEITFRAHRKRSRHVMLMLVCLFLVVTVTIGLVIYFIGHDSASSSSSLSSSSLLPPVIKLANVQGSLTVIDGPFAAYNQMMADSSSLAFNYVRNAFIYEMDKIFFSSDYATLYNRTQVSLISNNRSHTQLSFVIHVEPNTTASPAVLDRFKVILISGFSNSIFGLDPSSTSLKAMVISPKMAPTPAPGQCQPVHISRCANNTEYMSTTFPNVLGHRSPQEAEMAIRTQYEHLFMKPCYGYAADFYCSVFAPECGSDGKPIPPCRQYCQDVMAACNASYGNVAPLPLACQDLPNSEDPKVCRQNPYHPGVCTPLTIEACHAKGINQTAYPSVLGAITLDVDSIVFTNIIQVTTNCFKHSVLFSCALFAPPCSGRPYPHHVIPPCSSLCFAYRNRCEIFHDIFNQHWPAPLNCSDFPDSPDPSVCVGYHEAREPEVIECGKGEIKCGNDRCIKTTWLCDGFQDCDDNVDEAHCATCGPDQQMCSPASSLCINKSQGCDGLNDCYMNVDEHFCVRMNLELDQNVLEVYNSVLSDWEEVCKEGWTSTFSDLACQQLGYKKALATYYEVETKARKSKVSTPKNGSDPDKLQSYMDKGHDRCSSGYVVKIVCWETECGIRPAYFKSATRVVGGDEAKPGAWPWMASLHGGSAQTFFCGATVIDPEWVLTAGHCVGGGDREPSYWRVKTGSTRRVAFSEHRQVRKVKALFSHPQFSMSTVDNDIALIQLEKPLAMNDFVRPICLPEEQPDIGTRCYATGWGKTTQDDLGYEPALRQVSVDVTSWEACRLAVNKNEKDVPYKLTGNMFCAGGALAHDACQGDSGGPLVCRTDNTTDHWYQGGIVSWGVVCGQPNTPGVYTKLPLYNNWIHEIMANFSHHETDYRSRG